jgi:hypothetical protein
MSAASAYQGRSIRSAGAGARARRDRQVGAARARAGTRVRWDRLGTVALLLVGLALLYLYLSVGIRMLSTWRQARHDSAAVAAMEREHVTLERQHETLGRRGTLEEEARQLGMMKAGERSYIVSGLPNN